jgi:hypothetical protein
MELGFVLREFPLWVDSFATRSEGFARLGEKWSCAGTVAVSLSLSKDEAVTEEREKVSRIGSLDSQLAQGRRRRGLKCSV